jgi:hypothetical protein
MHDQNHKKCQNKAGTVLANDRYAGEWFADKKVVILNTGDING